MCETWLNQVANVETRLKTQNCMAIFPATGRIF